jgi:hypothetical protein
MSLLSLEFSITNNCVKSGGNEVDENGLEEGDSDNSQQREILQQVPLNEGAKKEELAIENNGEGTSKEVECLQNCETDYVQSGSSEQKYGITFLQAILIYFITTTFHTIICNFLRSYIFTFSVSFSVFIINVFI